MEQNISVRSGLNRINRGHQEVHSIAGAEVWKRQRTTSLLLKEAKEEESEKERKYGDREVSCHLTNGECKCEERAIEQEKKKNTEWLPDDIILWIKGEVLHLQPFKEEVLLQYYPTSSPFKVWRWPGNENDINNINRHIFSDVNQSQHFLMLLP